MLGAAGFIGGGASVLRANLQAKEKNNKHLIIGDTTDR